MSIPVLILFVLFFALFCPAFLYWFTLYLRDPRNKRPSFIGFPQDDGGFSQESGFPHNSGFAEHRRTDRAQAPNMQRIDAAQERR
jgi:hypothetical protein